MNAYEVTDEMVDAALSWMEQWVRKAERERHPQAFRDDMCAAIAAAIDAKKE